MKKGASGFLSAQSSTLKSGGRNPSLIMAPTKKLKNSEVAVIEDYKRRLRAAKSKGNWTEVISILGQLGNQYRLLGDYEEALETHEEEVKMYRTHKRSDQMGLGLAFRNTAEVYIDKKDPKKGMKFAKLYLEMARDEANLVEQQRAMITLGRVKLLEMEEEEEAKVAVVREAEEWFRKAYELLGHAGLKEKLSSEKEFMAMKCNNCQNIGVTLEMRESDNAIKWFQKAVEIGKSHGLWDNVQPCQLAICNLLLKEKQYKEALAAVEDAVKISEKLESFTMEIESKLIEAKVRFFSEDIEYGKMILKRLRKKIKSKSKTEYKEYLEELDSLLLPAVKLSRKLDRLFNVDKSKNSSVLKKLYEGIADLYAELNVFHLAIENYLKAVQFAERDGENSKKIASLYFSIAECYKDDKDYRNALEYYTKEMSCHDPDSEEAFKTQTHITQLLEKIKNKHDVCEAHREALRLARSNGNQKLLKLAYYNFAMYLKSVKDNSAEEYFKHCERLGGCNSEELLTDNSQEDDVCLDSEDEVDLDNLSSDGQSEEEDGANGESRNVVQAKRRVSAKRRNEAGETPLHLAAKRGDVAAVRKYLRQGVKVNERDTAGWTPLHEAANYGHDAVVETLLENGADVNDPGGALCEGITPLHDALSNGHFAVANVLLDHGASVVVKDKKKKVPVDHLLMWRHTLTPEIFAEVREQYEKMRQRLIGEMAGRGIVYTASDEKNAKKDAKNRCPSPEFRLLEPTRAHESFPVPVCIATDNFDPDNAEEASKEYANTMSKLRRGRGKQTNSKKPVARPISPGPRTALIPDDLDVHESWMVSDSQELVPQPSTSRNYGRRKNNVPNWSESSSSEPEREDSPVRPAASKPSKRPISPESTSSVSSGEGDIIFESSSSGRSSKPARKKLNNRPSYESTSSRGKENSVIQNYGSNDEMEIVEIKSPVKKRQIQTSLPVKIIKHPPPPRKAKAEAKISPLATQNLSSKKIWRFRIKVNETVFLVPVSSENQSKPIQWLCDEAASRYDQSYGAKPQLTLTTAEGAVLCSTDPIDLVLGDSVDSELTAVVSKLKVPPLWSRFLSACEELCYQPRMVVVDGMKKMEETPETLDLSGLSITGKCATALFNSFSANENLKVLSLSNCCLGDRDMAYFADALRSLNSLKELNLAGNMLTSEGLQAISNGVLKEGPSNFSLQILNLDYNPLEIEATPFLFEIAKNLLQLKCISLNFCGVYWDKFCLKLGRKGGDFCRSPLPGPRRLSNSEDGLLSSADNRATKWEMNYLDPVRLEILRSIF